MCKKNQDQPDSNDLDKNDLNQAELDDLLLDHNKSPRCSAELKNPDISHIKKNPLCGDKIEIKLKLEDEQVKELQVIATGCLLSRVSASVMAENIKGLNIKEALALKKTFLDSVFKDIISKNLAPELEALKIIAQHPMRQKCLSLGWECFEEGVRDNLNFKS